MKMKMSNEAKFFRIMQFSKLKNIAMAYSKCVFALKCIPIAALKKRNASTH